MLKRTAIIPVLLALISMALGGCNSSTAPVGSPLEGQVSPGPDSAVPPTAEPEAEFGGFTVTVAWPDVEAELVPVGSRSIKFVIVRKGTNDELAPASILTRTSPSATVSGLRAGTECTLTATAYPNVDATGVAQASASIDATVLGNTVQTVPLVMKSSIVSVQVTPAQQTFYGQWGGTVGGSVGLTVTARNAVGQVVLVPSNNWQWVSSNPSVATVNASGFVSAIAQGAATITVTETESGMSAASEIRVEGAPDGRIEGTVYAPDGATPIAGAVIYAPRPQNPTAVQVSPREEPPEDYYISTTSAVDGTFALSGIPPLNVTMKIRKGMWRKTFTVFVPEHTTVKVPPEDTTLSAPNIALVTGAADALENVLAKLGLGEVDSNGQLVLGTEEFDLYDGGTGLPSTYPAVDELVTDPSKLNEYDIVFFACLADESPLSDSQVLTNVEQFVDNGGKYYVTCWAQDWVEEPFPEVLSAEQTGLFDEIPGQVLDANLRQWLEDRGALGEGEDTVGILDSWAVINSMASNAKVWVEGNQEGYGLNPLTITSDYGSGRILYGVYHTVPWLVVTVGLLPQEYILAYLVFEV